MKIFAAYTTSKNTQRMEKQCILGEIQYDVFQNRSNDEE